MTRMLVSVRTPEEAEIALAGGADIIDLHAVAPDLTDAAIAAVGGRRPVSATAGNLPARPDLISATVQAPGLNYVRMGICTGSDVATCITKLATNASQAKLLAVFFVSTPPDLSLLPLLARSGFAGAMIDLQGESLLHHIHIAHLLGFVEACHAAGLIAGLAGGLEMPDIPRLLVLAPDLLGFGDALRRSGAELDLSWVRAVRALIPPETQIAEGRDVDYRLVAARTPAPAVIDDVPVDLVFVDDLVLPVFIGAYARERDAPQNVRFAVTASVMRTGRIAEDMRDVFSYDLITDGIRMLVGSGHVTFVETLAERIATMVLGHPRVTKVVVRVEKLETGSGTVGVEIERRRSAVRAADRPAPLLMEVPKEASGAG